MLFILNEKSNSKSQQLEKHLKFNGDRINKRLKWVYFTVSTLVDTLLNFSQLYDTINHTLERLLLYKRGTNITRKRKCNSSFLNGQSLTTRFQRNMIYNMLYFCKDFDLVNFLF